MASKIEVDEFLRDVRATLEYGSFYFADRDKNLDAMSKMGMVEWDVRAVLEGLNSCHYCEGPLPDLDRAGDVWIFGRRYEGWDLYVKLKLEPKPGKQTVLLVKVLSFHPQEHPLAFPYGGQGT